MTDIVEEFQAAFQGACTRYDDPQLSKRKAALDSAVALFREMKAEIGRLREVEWRYLDLCK